MKSSNLMTMDFVTYQGRVVCITALDIDTKSIRGTYIDDGEDTDWFNEDFATAITLSEEMLKNNGFEYREFTGYESMHYNHLFTIYLNKDGEIFILIGGEQRWMRYANELQHALRLCNLNELDELANNFKV